MPRPTIRTRRRRAGGVRVGTPGGFVTPPAGSFVPNVKLDPSQVRDLRGGRSVPDAILTRVVGKVKSARANLGRMLGGVDQRATGRSKLARFDKPMSAGRGTFVPTVRLDASQVRDWRRPRTDPKIRVPSPEGRYADEAGQPPLRKRSRINFRKRAGR